LSPLGCQTVATTSGGLLIGLLALLLRRRLP
jgi:hypothetical protein